MQRPRPYFMQWLLRCAWLLLLLCLAGQAHAITYANTTYTFNWIDASSHTKIGYNTSPYKFNGSSGCGTTPPVIDDTISDQIPIGFSFMYAGVNFTQLRVVSNGRVQFNNNQTCGFGSPVQQSPYPDTALKYTMRIYGNDLDPTLKSEVPSGYNTTCLSRASCYVSYATIGVAPYRSFVVTWNNVPEWTTGSTATGSYSLQLILQENGEFIYQYGDDVPGPSAALGQVGWEVDTNDYDTPKTGFPTSNSAIKYYIPRPVAEYRMEQPSWSSAAGQVFDTSGNGQHGTVLGGAQTIAAGKVCRAASFPLNTSSGAVDAIDTGISVPTAIGSAGTVTFWYKANTAWSGGGARDAQLLDATIANNKFFFLTRRSNGNLRFVITDSNGAVQAVETSGISVSAGTWKHIAVTWSFNSIVTNNSDHLRIYVDGVLQKEQAFTSSGTVSAQIGTLYLGDNRSGTVGSNGSGNSADGAFDELRVYNYEGGLALVQRDQSQGQAGCLSHYAVSDAGTGLTCQQNTVTVTAHDINHSNIVMPNNTTQIQLKTSTGLGDWSLISGYGVLVNGTSNDGIATYLFNGEYQAVFALTHATAATVSINVTDGQFTESATEDTALVVKTCVAARFNACELSTPHCVPSSALNYARLNTKLPGGFTLDLVKLKADATLESTFNGVATVDLLANTGVGVALDVNNCPATYTATIPIGSVTFANGYVVGGLTVPASAFAATAPYYSVYRNVRVRVQCNKANCGTANTACSTDNFAIRPRDFALALTVPGQSAPYRIKAGTPFTLTATAVPGYDGVPQVDINKNNKKIFTDVERLDFTDKLALVYDSGNKAAIDTGTAVNQTLTYDDVGYFGVLAGGVFDSSFAGSVDQGDCIADSSSNTPVGGKVGCNIGNQADTATFGRFTVDHYEVMGSMALPCTDNALLYMGQPELGIALGATALSSKGVRLGHYTTGYANLAALTLSGENGATTINPLSSRLAPALPALAWTGGDSGRTLTTTDAAGYATGSTQIALTGSGTVQAGDIVRFAGDSNQYTVATGVTGSGMITLAAPGLQQAVAPSTGVSFFHSFSRLPANGTPAQDGPYDNFTLRLGISDADGALISKLNGAAITPASSVSFGGAMLRHGRLRIDNAYGSELLALPVGLTAQYWNGTSFATNTADTNCTSVVPANFSVTKGNGAAVTTSVAIKPSGATSLNLSSGVSSSLRLSKPVPAPAGKGSVVLKTLAPLDGYLPGTGTETFGVYKSGPVIYLREMF